MRLYRFLSFVLISIAGIACSDSSHKKNFSNILSESAFDPKPDDTSTLESQTKRFKGQTKFLNPGNSIWDGYHLTAARSEDSPASREIQESDIFKIGPENSKLLYLLNNYRGLQVVSYESGSESPVIRGRVPATGNWPDDMYTDEAHNRLLVLENIYTTSDEDYYDYSTQQSRLLTYDVSDSSKPKIAETIKLQGRIRDSRIVGSVLYVATSVRPSYSEQQRGNSGTGYVYSFSLSGSSVELVDTFTLSAPVNYNENMNIVESNADGQLKYYLIAVLADYSQWSWFGKRPIEVIDISDPLGKIKPMMIVESKGNVNERSQTQIKNGALIVTSNFTNQSNLLRIAVESFILPTTEASTITAFEAEYRQLAIEREIKKLRAELNQQGLPEDVISDRVKELKDRLSSSGELALKGLFVEAEGQKNSPSKLMPDDVITFGSTQGLSARLQEVRYENDLLYAFWVPANNIDPLDVINIADPKNLTHLSHLEFDGWIQRAIPISYSGKSYIIGLGWVIPRIDNDDMRRYPQVMLFEVKVSDNSVETKVISQKNLSGSGVWANFDTPDKFIELRMTSDASGMLMYPFSSWTSGSYTSGGQLVGVDLTKIETDPANVFSTGSIVKAEENWLRRIFNNPEIDRINTFTDLSLGTYNVGQNVGTADTFVEAANVLELARNIVDYQSFENGSKTFGIQIVSSDYWWSRSEDSVTYLRLVTSDKADAELNETLATVKLNGSFVDAVVEKNQRLLVLTKSWNKDDNSAWKQEIDLHEIDLRNTPSVFVDSAKANLGTYLQSVSSVTENVKNLLKLRDGSIVATFDDKAFLVGGAAAGQIQISNINAERCISDTAKDVHFHAFNGRIWTHFTEKVDDPEHANYFYDRHFISEITNDGSSCSNPTNIPGIPLLIEESGRIVTQDTRLIELTKHENDSYTYYDSRTEKVLSSLRYLEPSSTASLVDIYDAEQREISALEVLPTGHIMFIESTQKSSYWFDSFSDNIRWPGRHPGSSQSNRFAILAGDDEFNFTKRSYALGLSGKTHATLSQTKIVDGNIFAVTKQGLSYSIWQIDANWNLKQLKLKAVGSESEPSEKVSAPGWAYGDLNKQVHINDQATGLEILNGYFGISQFEIIK